MADEQRLGKILPIRDWCDSAFGDHGKSTQLKSVIRGRCYLREKFEFPGVTHLLDFIHFTYMFFCVTCYLINCLTSGKEDLFGVIILCVYEVTQGSQLVVIPLRQTHRKRPHSLSLTSKCQLSLERKVLDLESEVHERPGFYSHCR